MVIPCKDINNISYCTMGGASAVFFNIKTLFSMLCAIDINNLKDVSLVFSHQRNKNIIVFQVKH